MRERVELTPDSQNKWESRRLASRDDVLRFTGVPVSLRVAEAYKRVVW